MDLIDAYVVLDVPESASDSEIKSAFKRAARRTHPDVNHEPGAEAAFKLVAAAYEILSDPIKRREHDAMRAEARKPRCRTCGAPVAHTGKRCATCQQGGRSRGGVHRTNHGYPRSPVMTSVAVVRDHVGPGMMGRPLRPYDPELYWGEQDSLEARFGHLGWWTRAGVPRWRGG